MGRGNRLFGGGDQPQLLAVPQGMPPEWQARAIALGLALDLRSGATQPADSIRAAREFESFITTGQAPGGAGQGGGGS